MGLPVLRWLHHRPTSDTAISGTMRVAGNGCFLLENGTQHMFIVWPDGFEDDGAQVRTLSGDPITNGDTVTGTGAVLQHDAATEAGGGRDSRLGQAIGYCAPGMDIAVLTEVTAP
jgi:hypothetical protein